GLAALAIPAGTVHGLPFGVSLIGKAFTDSTLAAIAKSVPATARLAVVGAHLSGQPLNNELVSRGAVLLQETTTADTYKLFVLDTAPPKPGLVRDSSGAAIAAEVWELSMAGFGSFVAGLPGPMAIGRVELADGTWVPGFTCERHALSGAEDITSFGGWRAYLARD
ncbi:MAG: allophanate hydrolase, partial [Kibdelosporangium sp.]